VSTARPMLFSGPMVRALQAGTKTQTRRVVKRQPPTGTVQFCTYHHPDPRPHYWAMDSGSLMDFAVPCPYGQPGDQLWVRESGWERPYRTAKMMREGADTWQPYYYDADGITADDACNFKQWGFIRRPSIRMPRWASRITLEITQVCVERLQNISETDALAEGISSVRTPEWDARHFPVWHREFEQVRATGAKPPLGPMPSQAYAALWDEINGPGAWALNPWVWVVEFKRVQP
jgi:hypothetical protein